MKASLFSAIALMVAIALPAGARPPHAVTEDGHEFTASMFTLPSSTAGTFSVLRCTTCTRQSFTLSVTTQYFIGKGEVTFAEFRRALAEHPNADVLIVTPIGTNDVTRIKSSLVDQQ